MLDLEPIEAREQKATQGPWRIGEGTKETGYAGSDTVLKQDNAYVVAQRATYPGKENIEFNQQVYDDMVFIAHSREDVPALIADDKQLRDENYGLSEEIAELREDVAELHAQIERLLNVEG